MSQAKRVRLADRLLEAQRLEELRAEWSVEHVAAFCCVSTAFIYRSDCPRIEKRGVTGIAGKSMIRFIPADVRRWNDRRTKHTDEDAA